MHRHGYQGRKFGREKDPRTALLRGLAESLVREGSLTTTRPKAKEVVPFMEVLITKAKKGDLANRRRLMRDLTVESAHKLMDDLAPKLSGRNSGHLRVKPAGYRRGDNAQMATVSFVDDISAKAQAKPAAKPSTAKKNDKAADEKVKSTSQPAVEKTARQPHGETVKRAARRSGVRGNR